MRKAISKHGKVLAKTRKLWVCKGCGRLIPKGSHVLVWNMWINRKLNRWRFCSDCQEVIYDCDGREPINYQRDEHLVRDFCKSCDSYPVCDKVEYLRKSKVGDINFADLEMYQTRWSDDEISANNN